MDTPSSLPAAVRRGTITAIDRHGWPDHIADEFDLTDIPTTVGTTLVDRTRHARIWTLRLAPGERFPVHRHRSTYLWLATSSGTATQHLSNGETRNIDYTLGDSELTLVPDGDTFDHDLENTGADELTFVTVELGDEPAGAPSPAGHVEPPPSHLDLLTAPHFAHLATIRPDGSPQSSTMWFHWDGHGLRFTHTRGRQKIRNLRHDPRVSVHIQDPTAPYRTLEIRGMVESIETDHDAAFYRQLQQDYGKAHPVYDAAERVVITVRPSQFVPIEGGLTRTEQRHLHQLLEQLKPAAD